MRPRLTSLRLASAEMPVRARFLESAAGAALITVLVGGLFSTVITGIIQSGAKDREFENKLVESFAQHKLELLKARLISERETLVLALNLLGKAMSHAQSRVDIDGPRFAVRLDPAKEKINEEQKQLVRGQFNVARDDWEISNASTGYQLSYYYGSSAAAWSDVSSKITAALKCADETTAELWTDTRCGAEFLAAQKSARDLAAHLVPGTHEWIEKDEIAKVRAAIQP